MSHVTKVVLGNRDLNLLVGFVPSCVFLGIISSGLIHNFCFGLNRESFEPVLRGRAKKHSFDLQNKLENSRRVASRTELDFWLQLIFISEERY